MKINNDYMTIEEKKEIALAFIKLEKEGRLPPHFKQDMRDGYKKRKKGCVDGAFFRKMEVRILDGRISQTDEILVEIAADLMLQYFKKVQKLKQELIFLFN